MVQPLPVAEGGRATDVAAAISRSLREARKQLADERRCEMAIATGNQDQAIQHARAAIAAYPQATLARVCMAQALVNKKTPVDSVIALTQQVLQIDPRNRPALALAAQAYTDANRDSMAVDAWMRLLALDPTNVKLQTQVVNILAASGNVDPALPIIDTAVAQNPGDPELLRLQFLVHLTVAAKKGSGWKGVIAPGEALLKSDTTVDTLFFRRLATAYAADSQPQKAAETTARGVAKFANNAGLWAFHASMLRAAGQNQQALEAVRRALAIDPKNTTALLSMADIQSDLNQTDSAIATLRIAAQGATDGDKAAVGQRLLILGNRTFKAAQATQTRADWEKAVALLALADSTVSSPQSNFLLGVAAFQVGDKAVRENQSAKSCPLAQLSERMFTLVQLHLPKGATVQPQTAGQLMGAVQQYTPAVEQQKKKFCRNR
jgi:tetratricopeptide (TPR) repeat protein